MDRATLNIWLFAIIAVLVALPDPAESQTIFGTILGTATDSSGAVIPGVKIRVTNIDTASEREAESDGQGNYEVSALLPGRYRVTAERAGFQRLLRDGIELQTRQVARVDLALTVGDVASTVSVTAEAPLVESETARIADTRSGENLRSLPYNRLSPYSFFALSPGVNANVSGSTFGFAGSWLRQTHFAIDGVSAAAGTNGTGMASIVNNLENYQEMKVDLSNNSAENGGVGTVTLVSRSGSNEIHGSLFETYISPGLRATNPFTFLKNRTVTNQFGGSFGAPVWIPKVYNGRNRTFFFYAHMDLLNSAQVTNLTPTVPLAAWKRGDFSGLTQVQLRDPSSGMPFPGNMIPVSRINPVAQKMQERFYPDPNFGNPNVFAVQNWRGQERPPARNPFKRSVRIDHKISDANTLFGRFSVENAHGADWLGNLPTMGQNKQVRYGRHITLVDTHVFNPRVVNEFRFGIPRDYNDFYERAFPGLPFVQEFGIQGLAPDIPADAGGVPRVRFAGSGAVENLDTGAGARPLDTTFQYYDQVNWFRGRHSLKFGGQLLKVKFENLSVPVALFGDWLFTNRYTGWAYADFLLGLPSEARRDYPNPQIRQRRTAWDFFVHDDFKLHPRLTLNLGVRYEYHPNWTEVDGLMANFDVSRQSLVVPDGAASKVSPLFSAMFPKVNVIEANQAGVPGQTLVHNDKNNVAPRIGLAFRPFGHARSVIRAGYGIFYNVAPLQQGAGGSPFKLDEPTFINPTARPELVWPLAYPASGVTPSAVAFPSFASRDVGFADPYTQQWNLTLEQQFGATGVRLSYIGTVSRLMEYTRDVNSPAPNSTPYIQKPRPLPDYAAIPFTENGATHSYHSLQIEAERHLSSGLYYQVGYALAKDMGDHHRAQENPFDRRIERSPAGRIPMHRLTSNFLWELPVGRGKPVASDASGFLQGLVGGWALSGIVNLQSGDYLTPTYNAPDIHTNIAHTTSLTAPTVSRRPDRVGDGNLPGDERTAARWFDTTAFKDPGCPAATPFCAGAARTSVGRFGNAGNSIIDGPGTALIHLGLQKNFLIRERVRMRFEFTGTNVINRKNFNNPALDLSNPVAVGRITGVGGAGGTFDAPGPREMRLEFRLDF